MVSQCWKTKQAIDLNKKIYKYINMQTMRHMHSRVVNRFSKHTSLPKLQSPPHHPSSHTGPTALRRPPSAGERCGASLMDSIVAPGFGWFCMAHGTKNPNPQNSSGNAFPWNWGKMCCPHTPSRLVKSLSKSIKTALTKSSNQPNNQLTYHRVSFLLGLLWSTQPNWKNLPFLWHPHLAPGIYGLARRTAHRAGPDKQNEVLGEIWHSKKLNGLDCFLLLPGVFKPSRWNGICSSDMLASFGLFSRSSKSTKPRAYQKVQPPGESKQQGLKCSIENFELFGCWWINRITTGGRKHHLQWSCNWENELHATMFQLRIETNPCSYAWQQAKGKWLIRPSAAKLWEGARHWQRTTT